MKRAIIDNLKNVPGWHSAEKLVVLAVDDYGNVCLDSIDARSRLASAGLAMASRFDRLDALETRQDLDFLYEVLSSVKDQNGRHAVVSAYTVCANPDFSKMLRERDKYKYESLPTTFARLAADYPESYSGAWNLWKQGVASGLLAPEFHGREHLNIELLERKMDIGDEELLCNLENRSMVSLQSDPGMPGVGFTHAYATLNNSSLRRHQQIINDGVELFARIFDIRPKTFAPPALRLDSSLYGFVQSQGILGIDKPFHDLHFSGSDSNGTRFNFLGRKSDQSHVSIVRNVVFEPTYDAGFDAVEMALRQVAAAFRWRKPAIISSHRVNFSGHIDETNRNVGLAALSRLLHRVTARWPDVKFVSSTELVEKITLSEK